MVDRKIAEAVADEARRFELTDAFRAARTLPGYDSWDTAIQAQYALPPASPGDVRAAAGKPSAGSSDR